MQISNCRFVKRFNSRKFWRSDQHEELVGLVHEEGLPRRMSSALLYHRGGKSESLKKIIFDNFSWRILILNVSVRFIQACHFFVITFTKNLAFRMCIKVFLYNIFHLSIGPWSDTKNKIKVSKCYPQIQKLIWIFYHKPVNVFLYKSFIVHLSTGPWSDTNNKIKVSKCYPQIQKL